MNSSLLGFEGNIVIIFRHNNYRTLVLTLPTHVNRLMKWYKKILIILNASNAGIQCYIE